MPPVRADFPSRAAENPTGTSPIGASSTSTNTTKANLLGASLTGTDLTRADPTGADPTSASPTSTNPNSANLTRTNGTGPLPVDALALDPEAYRRRSEAGHGQIRLAQKGLDLRDLLRRPAPLQLHRSS
ncbi:hypothetical protein CHE218_06980 [Microbacterium sp. che218]